jgi:hypothetical protein
MKKAAQWKRPLVYLADFIKEILVAGEGLEPPTRGL